VRLFLLPFLGLALAGQVLEGPLVLSTPNAVLKDVVVVGRKEGSVLVLKAPGIRLENVRVEGVGEKDDFFEPDAAVRMEGCHGCQVLGLEVQTPSAALRIEASRDVRVEGVRARGEGRAPGILAYNTPRLLLRDSRLEGFLDGIYLELAPEAQVLENQVEGSFRYGLHLMFTYRARVEGNRLRANRAGSAVMHGAENRVLRNVFEAQRGPLASGLLVQGETGGEFAQNVFRENTVGLFLLSSQGGLYRENLFLRNGFAILVQKDRSGENRAEFLANRFLGNLYDLAVDDPSPRLVFRENAFDRALPLDLDGDGRGDLPYLPATGFALWVSRHPPLSLFAESPAVLLWQEAERLVPGLRLSLADPAPLPLGRPGGRPEVGMLALGLVFLGGALWWRR